MKPICTTLLFLTSSLTLYGQNYEKIIFNTSISDGYYLVVQPNSDELKGALLLLPGFGQDAESIFPESKLPNVAYVNGILTVALAGGLKLYADDPVVERFNQALEHIKDKYGVPADKFIIGGYSAGGTISLRYAEYCNEMKDEAPIIPQAVFTVDSPVDLF